IHLLGSVFFSTMFESYCSCFSYSLSLLLFFFFFFNDTATTEIYTLSLHDALPILLVRSRSPLGAPTVLRNHPGDPCPSGSPGGRSEEHTSELRHSQISYAVFCLKKKNAHTTILSTTEHLSHRSEPPRDV